jgi:hypothetical protein
MRSTDVLDPGSVSERIAGRRGSLDWGRFGQGAVDDDDAVAGPFNRLLKARDIRSGMLVMERPCKRGRNYGIADDAY